MGYNDKNTRDVVTIFGRKMVTPSLDETGRNKPIQIPSHVFFVLPDGTTKRVSTAQDIMIGRRPRKEDPEVTIDLEAYNGHSLGVSRHHAIIKHMKDALILVDLDSINGTFVNGQRAVRTKRYALMDGDEISFGKVTLVLAFEEPHKH